MGKGGAAYGGSNAVRPPAPGGAVAHGGRADIARRKRARGRGMSEAIAFDTHRFVKRLTENGFTEQQAETLADEQVALLNANLATKADIAEIKAGMDALRQETKAEIAKVEAGVEALRQETRAGIEALRQETRAEIAKVEAGMETLRQENRADIAKVEARMETIKSDLLKWLFGALIAQGGLIVALVKLL